MQCAAILASGKQCSRSAEAGTRTCYQHHDRNALRSAPTFYSGNLTPQEQKLLQEAAQLEGVESEVAVLRTLIRQMTNEGDLEAARRAIEALGRLLRNREATSDRAGQLTSWLDSVLARIDEDRLARFGESLDPAHAPAGETPIAPALEVASEHPGPLQRDSLEETVP